MTSTRQGGLRGAWTALLVLVDTFRVVLTVPPEPPHDKPDERPEDHQGHPREEDR